MTKITLDRETFKALASDTRLDILKVLDGKNLGLNEIAKVTNLNKATLHEHLTKLNEAGLIKRTDREGHKWVYYRLTWKGESLLHPENTRIVVLFSVTFVALAVGVLNFIMYIKGTLLSTMENHGFDFEKAGQGIGNNTFNDTTRSVWDNIYGNTTEMNTSSAPLLITKENGGIVSFFYQDPLFLTIGFLCFVIFTVVLCFSLWRYWENRTPKF